MWRSMAAALATAAAVSSFVPAPSHSSSSLHAHPSNVFGTAFYPNNHGIASCQEQQQQQQQQQARKMQVDDSYHYEKMNHPSRTTSESHVIFGHLLQPNLLEKYHIYKRINHNNSSNTTNNTMQEIVVADIRLGERLDGHEGVVHGGILALLIDDTMGYAFEAMDVSHAVTANLHIDYRLPVPAGTLIVVKVYLKEQVGRKLYYQAEITCPKDSKKVYAEASSLFIIPREYYEDEQETNATAAVA